MPDPTGTSYLGLPGWVLLWILAVLAFVVFGRRAFILIRTLLRGRSEVRWDRVPERLRYVAVNVLGQKRLFDERTIGAAHFWIFWAFCFFAAAFAWNLIRGLFPFVPVPYADQIAWMTFPMQIIAVLALLGIGIAAVRRYVFTPDGLERSRDATLILLLITALLVSFLLAEGFGALAEGGNEPWSPVGNLLAGAFVALGVSQQSAADLYVGLWWLHMVIVLGFLAYLPYSKHVHLVFAPFGVFFAQLTPGALTASAEGASTLPEFTWRQLYSGLSCAECGRCDRACPAHATGSPLSPKTVIHEVKLMLLAEATGSSANGDKKALVGDVVKPEALWACTTCMACMHRCPVFNEHVPVIVEMRRHLVAEGEVGSSLQETLVKLQRYGNSFGKSSRTRARWAQDLPFKIKDARQDPVDYLWFVGDYAAFDPRLQEITRGVARVFTGAGLDFGLLYEDEQNAGTDVRRVGEEGLFSLLREKNLGAIGTARFNKVVTTDPHSYQALKHEYAMNGAGPLAGKPVLHYTEVLDGLLADGRLPVRNALSSAVTYHDPCYLGRYSGVFDPPRRILSRLGVRITEMPASRDRSFCCGAGGGRIWMEDVEGIAERPAERRVREAAGLAGVETLIVACPKDLVMFQDAIKTTGLEGRLAARDIIELVEDAL